MVLTSHYYGKEKIKTIAKHLSPLLLLSSSKKKSEEYLFILLLNKKVYGIIKNRFFQTIPMPNHSHPMLQSDSLVP